MFYILVAKLRHIYQHGREQPPTRRKQAAIAVVDPKCLCLMSLGRNVWFRRVSGWSPCFLPGFRKGSQARTISSCTSTLFCRYVAALPRLLDLLIWRWAGVILYPLPSVLQLCIIFSARVSIPASVVFQVLPNGPAQESASAVLQIVLTQREGESQEQYRQGLLLPTWARLTLTYQSTDRNMS